MPGGKKPIDDRRSLYGRGISQKLASLPHCRNATSQVQRHASEKTQIVNNCWFIQLPGRNQAVDAFMQGSRRLLRRTSANAAQGEDSSSGATARAATIAVGGTHCRPLGG